MFGILCIFFAIALAIFIMGNRRRQQESHLRRQRAIIFVLGCAILVALAIAFIRYFMWGMPSHTHLLKARNHRIRGFEKADEGKWHGPYAFIQGTDPQPGLIDQIAGGNGTKWTQEIIRLKKAIEGINNMTPPPGFVIITGDIVNAFPGEEPYKSEQTRDVLSCLDNLQVPTMVISGNHDLLNTPTRASIEEFRNQYGDDYYTFYYGGTMFIALNSQYFYNSSLVEDLAQEQTEWLKDQLNQAKLDEDVKHVVIFMHIPLFLNQGDEPDNYFNIHSPLRQELLSMFMKSKVKTVFTGHYHRNAGGIWSSVIDERKVSIECVVTSAIGAQLGKDKSGLQVVKVTEDRVAHKYYALDDIPQNPNKLPV